MDQELLRQSIELQGQLSFARSSGPGGQNVNKVSSATTLHTDLHRLEGVSDAERAMLFEKLANRINSQGELVVRAEDTRSQLENRRLVYERTLALIIKALHRDKPRRATKPTRASGERRIATKKRISSNKKNRQTPGTD